MKQSSISSNLFVYVVLLLAVVYSQQLCTSEVYDSYLEHYSAKCEGDCEEYKKWVVKMGG